MKPASMITNEKGFPHREDKPEPIGLLTNHIVVIIPSYNQERYIGSVVLKLLRFPVTVIVVDDGSIDETASVAAAAGAEVVQQPVNQGKGAAINAGFCKAREFKPDVIVIIDADGQHLPEELPRVVQPILDDVADIVVGSRYLSHPSHVPAHRVLGHLLFRWLSSVASGIAMSDPQSGYRAFSQRAFDLVNFSSRCSSVESEMQFMAYDHSLRVAEVPITIRYTDPPKRSVIRQGLSVLNGVLKLTGQYRPLLFFGLPGCLIVMLGIAWGIRVVDLFSRNHALPVGNTLISVMLCILGMTLFSTGVILHSIRGLLTELLQSRG
jgi:glycosyltransferase involved in cell wall biosynthesis